MTSQRKPINPATRRSNGWKGGRVMHTRGYVMIYQPEHPRAGPSGYVLEHVLIAEKALGHPLPPKAEIHHFDEIKANNSPGNLILCPNRAYHLLLHRRQRAQKACGNPSAIRCGYCCQYDRQDEIYRPRRTSGAITGYHRDCEKKAYARRQAARTSIAKEIS